MLDAACGRIATNANVWMRRRAEPARQSVLAVVGVIRRALAYVIVALGRARIVRMD